MSTSPAVAVERGLVDRQRLAGDRAERGVEALSERGAAAHRQPVDRGDHLVLDVGRPEHGDGAVAERDDADLDRRRLLFHERAGGALRRLDPGGLEILGAHAVRHVEGEDHRAFAARAARGSSSGARARTRRAASAGGEERERHVAAPAAAPRRRVGTSPSAASRAARPRSPADADTYATTSAGTTTRLSSIHGEPSDISAAAIALARLDDADEGGDEVVVGRDLVDVDAGTQRRRTQLGFTLPRRRRAAGAGTRRRSSRRSAAHPVSASSTTITPASGSSNSRGSTRRMATTSWRSVSCSSGRSQPGARDEVGDQHDQRAPPDRARARSRAARPGR